MYFLNSRYLIEFYFNKIKYDYVCIYNILLQTKNFIWN